MAAASGYVCDYAKSSRSKCRGCKTKIVAKEIRLGRQSEHPDFGVTTKWFHLDCFTVRKVDPEDVDGFDSLQPKDRKAVKEALSTAKKGKKRKSVASTTPTKTQKRMRRLPPDFEKMKMVELKQLCRERQLKTTGRKSILIGYLNDWQKIQDSCDPKKAASEEQKFNELVEELKSNNTVKVLKQMLLHNNQKRSGNKMELVTRIADCKMYGCLPQCEDCGGGRMFVIYDFPFGHGGQGRWRCNGYYDDEDFVPCGISTREKQERKKWKELDEDEDESED